SPSAQREQLVSAEGTTSVELSVSNLGANPTAFRTDLEVSFVQGARKEKVSKRYSVGTTNMQRDTTRSFTFKLPANDFLTTQQEADSASFEVKTIISEYAVDVDLSAELTVNDTNVFRQDFYTCYAYDDGSAENGFGIFGANAAGAKVAVRYYAYMSDTLSGIYLYFNNTQDDGNLAPFRLAVWSDAGGQPAGEALYLEPNLDPVFDSLNAFVYYPLAYPVVVKGTFYVGWVQQASGMLNVGFDRNSRVAETLMVSDNGYTWRPSIYDGQGALMVRPSFAKRTFDTPTAAPLAEAHYSLSVYPNPAHDVLAVGLPDALREKDLLLEIFDAFGQRVRAEALTASAVSIGDLPQGLYFIRLSHGAKRVAYARFVKQ
ncbi:MAG: T9SS type A sorting domain-containing protein, partial [Prevotellaceae bacterium]|nr:T9SS type A sorting domain-containing protein [Prevotellaceae bacterium]